MHVRVFILRKFRERLITASFHIVKLLARGVFAS